MDKKLKEYAALLIELGVNLQHGETLAIACPVECCDLAEEAARAAYERGAERVVMFWSSGKLSKLSYQYQSEKTLTEVPDYLVASRDFILGKKGAYLCIISDEPGLYEGLDAKKIAAASRATGKALIRFRESTSKNETRWCLAAYPNPAWAKKMFPSLPEKEALEKQWEYLHKTMRMDEGDPIARWRAHQEKLVARSKILNEKKIKSLHYVNALGTDFTVGMTDRYLRRGGDGRGRNRFYGEHADGRGVQFARPPHGERKTRRRDAPGAQRRGHRAFFHDLPGRADRGFLRRKGIRYAERDHFHGRRFALSRRDRTGGVPFSHPRAEYALLQHAVR